MGTLTCYGVQNGGSALATGDACNPQNDSLSTKSRRKAGYWSHNGIRTDKLEKAVEQLAAFPGAAWSAQAKLLQEQAALTIRIRTKLMAIETTESTAATKRQWTQLAEVLAHADPALIGAMDEARAALEELREMRERLLHEVVGAMARGRLMFAESVDVRRVMSCAPRQYYAILGLQSDADSNAIKQAYRRLAMKLHPDKCTDPGASEAFKRITVAHETLSDSRKRTAHDQLGGEAAGATVAPTHAAFVAAASTRRHEDIQTAELITAIDELAAFPPPSDAAQQEEQDALIARARTVVTVRAALKAASYEAPTTWARLAGELERAGSMVDDVEELQIAVSEIYAMRAQLEFAISQAMTRGRSLYVPQMNAYVHEEIKTDELQLAVDELLAFPALKRIPEPGMRGGLSRSGSFARTKAAPLPAAPLLPELKDAWPPPRENGMAMQGKVSIRVRKALRRASWTDPSSWRHVCEELDKAATDDPTLRDLEEIKGAYEEVAAMRGRLESTLTFEMGRFRSKRGRNGDWSHDDIRTDKLEYWLNQLKDFPQPGQNTESLIVQASLVVEIRKTLTSGNWFGLQDTGRTYGALRELLMSVPRELRGMSEVQDAQAELDWAMTVAGGTAYKA